MYEYILFLVLICVSIYFIMYMMSKGYYPDHGKITIIDPIKRIQQTENDDDDDNDRNSMIIDI